MRFLTLSTMIASLLSSAPTFAGGEAEATDCGTIALYQLLQIERPGIPWEKVVASLGRVPHEGHSLAELRDAARELGLDLRGVKLTLGQQLLDRPALAFVKRGDAGHFLLIRPVGTTGTLIQVLDGIRPPAVLEAAELATAPGWTSLALVPNRTSWPRLVGWVATIGSTTAIVICWMVTRVRRSRNQQRQEIQKSLV